MGLNSGFKGLIVFVLPKTEGPRVKKVANTNHPEAPGSHSQMTAVL